jgi:hypothetical protein
MASLRRFGAGVAAGERRCPLGRKYGTAKLSFVRLENTGKIQAGGCVDLSTTLLK